MSELKNFYYNKQLRSYMLQSLAVFAQMQVSVGKIDDVEPRLITVPIKNGSSDRVVADIKSEHTQNKPIRLPLMSGMLTNIALAPQLRKGVGQQRRNVHMPTGGVFPDDISVTKQLMPVPYMATFELGVWASNQDQHYQILEQILMLFDPILQIQTSDEVLDWTRLTTMELVGINMEENPPGADRRLIQSTLVFEFPIYLSLPTEVHNNFVKDILIRVGAVSSISANSADIVAELDQQGIAYSNASSIDDIELS